MAAGEQAIGLGISDAQEALRSRLDLTDDGATANEKHPTWLAKAKKHLQQRIRHEVDSILIPGVS